MNKFITVRILPKSVAKRCIEEKCRHAILPEGRQIFFATLRERLRKFYCLIVITSLISSCTLYTPPEVVSPQAPTKFKAENANNKTKTSANSRLIKNNWWENFNDAKLSQIVILALKNNFNYQVAIKNIQIAATYVTEAESSFFPEINVGHTVSRNRLSTNAAPSVLNNPYDLNSLQGTVSYEMDIWHQNANSVNQAKASLYGTEADSAVIKLSLISNIVNIYYSLEALNSNVFNLRQQYSAINKIVKLASNQYQSGLINIETLNAFKIQAETIKTKLSTAEKQKQIMQNTLAYLVGEYPEQFTYQINEPLKTFSFNQMIPPGIPAQMLAQRPDIISAYYQIVAFGYLQKEELANFLPAFTLTGAYGFASQELTNFFNSESVYWNYSASGLMTIFDYKKRLSQYKRAQLQYEAASLNYKNTVINAYAEVDNALTSYKQDYLSFNSYQKEFNYAKEALTSADAQYRSGIADYSAYLNYRLSYLQNEYNLTNQKLSVIQDIVQVYKTLGLVVMDSPKALN